MLPKGWKQVPLHTVAEVRTGLSKNARREGATLKRPYLILHDAEEDNGEHEHRRHRHDLEQTRTEERADLIDAESGKCGTDQRHQGKADDGITSAREQQPNDDNDDCNTDCCKQIRLLL